MFHFGFAEIMRNLEMTQTRDVVHAAIGNLLPNRKDFAQSAWPIARGTFLGGLLGSRRRPPQRPSIYRTVQRRLDEERASR